MLALFRRGIFLNPMGTKLYLSLAHDRAACDALLDRLDDALGEIGFSRTGDDSTGRTRPR